MRTARGSARMPPPQRRPAPAAGSERASGRSPEEPGLERLQALLARERAAVLGSSVPLTHCEVVLERRVRLLECVLQLIPLEEVVAGFHRLAVAQLRIDNPAYR